MGRFRLRKGGKFRSNFFLRHQRLLARAQFFYLHQRPLVAEEEGNARAELLGGLELLPDLRGGERIIDTETGIAQGLDLREGSGAALFFGDDDVDVEVTLRGCGVFHLLFRRRDLVDQFAEHYVTHRKTDRGQGNGAVAQLVDQVVVTPAAGERSQFSAAIERFENNAGVVCKTANNPEIHLDKIGEAASSKRFEETIEFLAASLAIEDSKNRFGQRS